MKTLDDRRVAPRFHVRWAASVRLEEHGASEGLIVNIAETGLLLVSRQIYEADELVEMDMVIGNAFRICGTARILREQPALLPWHAYGARFVEMADTDMQFLQTALDVMAELQALRSTSIALAA